MEARYSQNKVEIVQTGKRKCFSDSKSFVTKSLHFIISITTLITNYTNIPNEFNRINFV